MRFATPMWFNSLSLKILLAYLIGMVLSIMLVILAALWLMGTRSDYFAGADIAKLTQEQAKNLQFDQTGMPIGFDISEDDLSWIFESLKRETAYRVFDESGVIVLASAAGDDFWHSSDSAYHQQPGSFEFDYQGALIHGATAAVQYEEQTWYLQFAVSARFHYLIHRGFALPFMGIGIGLFSLVLLIVFSVCGYITLRYTLKPLREVSESATAISPNSLDARLSVERVPSEVAPLVNSFNKALDRLEYGYRIQQEFLATAAHELKTPLALIRAQIEVKEKSDDRDALLNDVEHMARQVQQLLLLAEVSEAQNYKLANVEVTEVADDVVNYLQPLAKTADVQLKVIHIQQADWQADRAALFVLLKNLVENAIQHAPQGTSVDIDISATQISVRDFGPGVTPEQLPQLFVRFWRGAHRRDHGAGLGLSICQEIAQAHGWTLSAHRAEPGLRFQLRQ